MDAAVVVAAITTTVAAITAAAAAVKQNYVPCERLSSWGPFSLSQSRTSEIYGGSVKLTSGFSVYQ